MSTGPVGAVWARLHPLSPLLRMSRGLGGLLVLMLVNLGGSAGSSHRGGFGGIYPYILVAVLVMGLGVGVISWLVTRWRIHEGDLQIDSGLIRRQSVRVPLTRIQAVDVITPLLGRVLGLAEVRVVLAGRGGERSRLAYLSVAEAREVRARLLALAHGLAPETPEPVAYPVFAVNNGDLVASLLLSAPGIVAIAVVLGATVVAVAVPHGVTLIAPGFTVLVGAISTMARRLNDDFGFAITEAPDGFRLQRGLFQTRAETIPFGRIQALRWVRPLCWRPFGWSRLEVDVARQRATRQSDQGSRSLTRTLVPVGNAAQVQWLLGRVMPGASIRIPPTSAVPGRAAWRAPLSRHYLAAWHDGGYVMARTGRVRPAVVVMPLAKVQSIRLRTGPVLRWLRLANLHVDTAGRRWAADACCRDAAEADAMLDRLAQLAERARVAATAATV